MKKWLSRFKAVDCKFTGMFFYHGFKSYFLQIFSRVCSLMVNQVAHNNRDVGSIPTKLNDSLVFYFLC